jgi:hypothetical protein
MKIYVVYDPLYEEPCSVHKTKEGAINRCYELNVKDSAGDNRNNGYPHEWSDFELEE